MQPKVGIVIVSYNAPLAVRATLASLRQAINNTPYKVLVIDNASGESERKDIRQAFDKHTSQEKLPWDYIQLKKNLGFAGGNNHGIKKILKDPEITHVCLLNSDVIVSDYWLDRLVEKPCEIVSAVTNKADSEQCVPIDYQLELGECIDTQTEIVPSFAFDTINAFSQKWNKAWKGNLVETDVTFFCVLLTRNLIKKVGLLDDKFFPGGFEDDDYCARIRAVGIKIWLARDVFMHHFGSASFGQLKQNYFSEKASKNKAYLEKKHQFVWQRRPEKPVTSFSMDILYSLKGAGDRSLQLYYHGLYIETLTKSISHIQKEFAAIHNHMVHCGQEIPEKLENAVSRAIQLGNIIDLWSEVLSDTNAELTKAPVAADRLRSIEAKLKTLCDAVYAKAEGNVVMVEFLREVGVFGSDKPAPSKSSWEKIKWFIKKGLPFFMNLKGMVFFGGYPYPERDQDGYFQRIRTIDNLFPDRWRIYVDHMIVPGKTSWYDFPAPKTLVLHAENHRYKWFMKIVVTLCVLRCRTIYYHSVLRMHDSNFGKFMKWPGLTRIIDIHGVVPEEFRLHNDFFSAGIYDSHEKVAISNADYVILVSEAMHKYFQQKYRELLHGNKVIILPIFPNLEITKDNKPYVDGKSVMVYAGGTHKWQQVPKMIDAMALTKDFCVHKFFCPNPAEVLDMMPESLRQHPNMEVDRKPFSELLEIYKQCHFGFILREDIIVNHAACPTKLVEYISMAIVPIVDCEEMGDFKTLGMQFIRVRDLIAGNLPDEATRFQMALTNFGVYNKLKELNYNGKAFLQDVLLVDNSFRAKAESLKSASDEFQIEITESLSVLPSIAACDVLVQVDNFLAGGLENVVLDLNQTLVQAGLRVSLLVLGEAGASVDRAKNNGIPVCVTSYDPETYRILLNSAAPKIVISHYSINRAATCSPLNIPLIQVIHNTYMWFTPEQAEQFSEAVKHTTSFIAVSDYARNYSLARLGVPKEKCIVIPNGIDVSRITEMEHQMERSKLRKQYGFTDRDFVFLSVGAITHQKNHICTVRAFHQALPDCPDAKLVILGKIYENQLWAEIQNYILENNLSEHIIYAGESSNPPAYYAMADAFVHSAFFEGGPLVLLEAVTANLPIVTTETGFAKHFKGKQGISMVPPAVDIIDYKGYIWQLQSTIECEMNLANEITVVYQERIKPDCSEQFIDQLDKQHTYQLYVNMIADFIKTGELVAPPSNSWVNLIPAQKTAKLARVS